MGGGVVGVATAWYLSQAGCEVTVIDRQNSVALETSFANCGEISPGYSTPWAAPGIPQKALKWLFTRHAPLKFNFDWSFFQLQFLRLILANCNSQAYVINKKHMITLAEYSRSKFSELRQQTGINYEDRQLGTLQIFRQQAQFDAIGKDIEILKDPTNGSPLVKLSIKAQKLAISKNIKEIKVSISHEDTMAMAVAIAC